jgi:hypothetical protein
MNIEWPLVVLATSGLLQFAGVLIWGATLSNRVKTIERDIEPLRLLGASVARMEARLEGLMEQLRDLNASIRWRGAPARDADGVGMTSATPATR